MGYRKLIDKDDFFEDVPGPVKDNNSRPKSIGGQIEVTDYDPETEGETPDGDAGNRHGSPVRYP